MFARSEGIIPAPEPTHAIRVAIDEALLAKEAGEAKKPSSSISPGRAWSISPLTTPSCLVR